MSKKVSYVVHLLLLWPIFSSSYMVANRYLNDDYFFEDRSLMDVASMVLSYFKDLLNVYINHFKC